jgi:OOP family OmpA-OmpF porin
MLESTTQQRSGLRITHAGTAALLGAALLAAGGCGGAMKFSDESALVIKGEPPTPAQLKPRPKPKPEPPAEPKRVEVTADAIVIRDKIMFESGKSTIRSESHALLDEIAGVLRDNPRIKKVSIEGHTDADGSEKYNRTLSQGRAEAVMQYLVGQGIEAERLGAVGHGEAKPIADNDTPEGKEENRRVELLITEQDEVTKLYEIDPDTGERREVQEEAP